MLMRVAMFASFQDYSEGVIFTERSVQNVQSAGEAWVQGIGWEGPEKGFII